MEQVQQTSFESEKLPIVTYEDIWQQTSSRLMQPLIEAELPKPKELAQAEQQTDPRPHID